jgi:hypothetical protein
MIAAAGSLAGTAAARAIAADGDPFGTPPRRSGRGWEFRKN